MGCGASSESTSGAAAAAALHSDKNNHQQRQPTNDDDDDVFDKVMVRLEHGCVPKTDMVGHCDPQVTVALVDVEPFPDTLFHGRRCSADRSDVAPLLTHTFSERSSASNPVWYEECMLVCYRSRRGVGTQPPPPPRGRLRLHAVDKDAVGADDVILSGFEVDPWDLDGSSCVGGGWHRFVAPCDCQEADPKKHHITFSVRVERGEERIVSKERLAAACMEEVVVSLRTGDLSGGGKAVVSYKTRPDNDKAFFWLPGLNASFHHVHVLDMLLDHGWDVFTIDCRRMGRSKQFAEALDPGWNCLDAHTTSAMEEYCEEIDAMIAMTLPPSPTQQTNNSGGTAAATPDANSIKAPSAAVVPIKTSYRHRVLYGNSTGSLVAVTYLHHGQHAASIDGLAVNGPFFDWNLASYAEVLMNSATLTSIYANLVDGGVGRYVQRGQGISPYSIKVWAQYFFDPHVGGGLRSIEALHTTSEWAKAVTKAQKALKTAEPLHIPIFVIGSMSDTWVRTDQVMQTCDLLGPRRTEIQVANAEHDVFLSSTREKVEECQQYLMQWLHAWFA